ncbi:hypothetical protein BDW02DRAFT_568259 [Decorospora gaudefroyi]|uniref:Uncharacterized protein n=1 Tax=Decorospora gaudefroyi TaxID=184978 RepID=A0A6A5KI62_9PLEO|nr:hypothetical protein BDW02DRAFT_568259 [Decorospora gaudefroyi]
MPYFSKQTSGALRCNGPRLSVVINDGYGTSDSLTTIGSISWGLLLRYCTAKEDPGKHVNTHPDGSQYVSLPAANCETEGVRAVLDWIKQADENHSYDILPSDLFLRAGPDGWSVLDLCCIERALLVLSLRYEADDVRLLLESRLKTPNVSVSELQEALEILPQGSYWCERLLTYINERLVELSHTEAKPDHYVCGWQREEDLTIHNNCISNWVGNDINLFLGLKQRFDQNYWEATKGDFGMLCEEETRTAVWNWVLRVEEQRPLPVGKFPRPGRFTSKELVRTYTQFDKNHKIHGNLKLEWSDHNGGCYIETLPTGPRYGMRARGMKTTDVSRAWLASRGQE